MSYKVSIGFDWQGSKNREEIFQRVQVAEEAGVDTVFTSEAWGQDAFTLLALLADRTKRVKLGTSIVNYFSRTPAALAQHFATLDELSEGRMIIGIGASSANVIEHFHGVPFNPPLVRLRETVDIINMLIAQEPLNYDGKLFHLERGFKLRFQTFRPKIPIYVAAFRPRSVKVVAEVADGWIPMMTPLHQLKPMIDDFRAHAAEHGRDADALTICGNGGVIVSPDREKARADGKARLAFYIARMGDYYYQQICDMGYREEADVVRKAWADSGSKAAYAAVPDAMLDALGAYGSVEECRDRLALEQAAGINLHRVAVQGAESPMEEGRLLEAMMK